MILKPMISVIGNIFVDLKGISDGPIYPDTKNVGRIEISHGGAARNAVHNLGILGARARFLSSYNEDATGMDVVRVLKQNGVDTSYMKGYSEGGMGRWLAVLDSSGTLISSVSEQPFLKNQEEAILGKLMEALSGTAAVGLDIGISERVTQEVSDFCLTHDIPLFGLVGNIDVVQRHPQSLSYIPTLICNEEEASILLNRKLNGSDEVLQGAKDLTQLGPHQIVITRAENGCIYFDKSQSLQGITPAKPAELLDSTGAGDSFFAGLLYGICCGKSLPSAIDFASAIAAKVIAQRGAVLSSDMELILK